MGQWGQMVLKLFCFMLCNCTCECQRGPEYSEMMLSNVQCQIERLLFVQTIGKVENQCVIQLLFF